MSSDEAWVGRPMDRVDGVAKVTGAARYAGETPLAGMLHAVLIMSAIPCGRISRMDLGVAEGVPGVVRILTHESVPRLPDQGEPSPPAGRALSLLQSDRVHYNNQPIGLVIAQSLEAAQDAARQVGVDYERSDAELSFERAQANAYPPPPKTMQRDPADSSRGDPAAALSRGVLRLDLRYTTPDQFHNPMEPHATLAQWQGDKLTIYDSTQYVSGVRSTVARALGIPKENIRVVCPFTGGGFGSKGSTWSHVVLAALAAQLTGRPVKLMVDRMQMFGPVGHRPRTQQSISIAAGRDGTLEAVRHDVVSTTSVIEDWTETSAIATRSLYACPNLSTSHRLVKMNVGTPTFMRAPGEASGTFALESALDEMAYRLGVDPIQLRLVNYTERDPDNEKPFTSKQLRECYRQGADQFGWARRAPVPRATQDGHELVGMGMATAVYPARRSQAHAMARLNADGSVVVRSGTQELGTGLYTIMTQIAADASGFPVTQVRFELGDTDYPEAPVSGGSQSSASVGPAVQAACANLRRAILTAALGDRHSPFFGGRADDLDLKEGWIVSRSDPQRRDAAVSIVARQGGAPIESRAAAGPGSEKEAYSAFSFGAVFAQVRVDEHLGMVRIEKVCGVYDIGQLLNEKTGKSQLMGGIVWGIGLALQEVGELDRRYGRIVNNNLAEYHVPVNADVPDIQITILNHPDVCFNPLGARGIGEIGITGAGAAIANAVYHATGTRVRDLPITLDKLM